LAGPAFAVLLLAVVVQLALASAYSYRRSKAPEGNGVPALLGLVCWVAAICCLLLVPAAIDLAGDLDPAECAPLTPGEAQGVAGVMGVALVGAGAMSAWAADRVRRGLTLFPQLMGEVGGLAVAVFGVFWLAGGTSC
jgi:hypothetical protein